MSDAENQALDEAGARLACAVDRCDWIAAAQAHRDLREVAEAMAAQSRWCVSRYHALERGTAALQKSMQGVSAERQRLAEEMDSLMRGSTAWRAYGQMQVTEDGG